jgi:hypothetical protein
MFLPPAVMRMSFLRSTIVSAPSGPSVPMSPVCSQPSVSIAAYVDTGWWR